MQSRMEVAWESERAEQKRLLNEAHELAMDLQRQLKCRDDEHSRERRALLEQLKKLRKELDEEQMLREKRLKQVVFKLNTFVANVMDCTSRHTC